MTRLPLALATLAALAVAGAPRPAAAETVNCTAITSLPATLSTQGVYCLKQDLSTAMASGNAITIAVNNVTIDCNGFKLGGLAAGAATQTNGIRAAARNNVVVRGCGIRGFAYGVYVDGFGHVVEGNRLDGNTRGGIVVVGDGGVIRENRVIATGNAVGTAIPTIGIYGMENVDILDNTVSGVVDALGASATGIYTYGDVGGAIERNRVRGVSSVVNNYRGIHSVVPSMMSVRDNHVVAAPGNGVGIDCDNGTSVASGNHVFGFDDDILNCVDGGKNLFK